MFSRPECHEIIASNAKSAAFVLWDVGHVFVQMEPDDGTRYNIVCVLNGLDDLIYVGVTNFSTSQGNGIYGYARNSFSHPTYVAEKTGIKAGGSVNVMADFINCLKNELNVLCDEDPELPLVEEVVQGGRS